MSRWHIARVVAAKDLRIELRSRVVINQVVPFAAVTMLMFAFALDATNVLERVAPGLVWLATLFSLLVLVQRSFAIEAERVHAVLRAPRVTTSPLPAPVEGLLSWQGEVLPVVSLAAFLGAAADGRRGPVLIVGRGAPELALRVSAADEVTEVSTDALRPAPADRSPAAALLKGALADGTLLLSGQALLEDPRLFF